MKCYVCFSFFLFAAGHKNGTCKEALFWDPAGLCLSKDENTLFVCDRHNHEIREIDLIKNTVNTICGSAQHKETKDGVGTQAHFVSCEMKIQRGGKKKTQNKQQTNF